MKEGAGALIEWRKIGWSLAGVVCVLTALLLFTPDALIARTGLVDLRNEYKPWFGLAFLISLSLFVASLLEAVVAKTQDLLKERRLHKNLRVVLQELTQDEKSFLQEYIANDQTSVSAPISDGVVGSLQAKKIVYRASTISTHHVNFQFNLQPWARKALTADPSLIDL